MLSARKAAEATGNQIEKNQIKPIPPFRILSTMTVKTPGT